MYALGLTLWQLFHKAQRPFGSVRYPSQLEEILGREPTAPLQFRETVPPQVKALINSMCSLDPDRRPPAASVCDQLFQIIPHEQRGPVSSLVPKSSERVADVDVQQSSDDLQHSQAFNANSSTDYTPVDAELEQTSECPIKQKQSDEWSGGTKSPPEKSENSEGGYSRFRVEDCEYEDKKDDDVSNQRSGASIRGKVRNLCSRFCV